MEKDKKEKIEKLQNDLPEPNQSRVESFLGFIAGQENAELPEPQSRIEKYLNHIALNGSIGGGSGEGLTPAQQLQINKIPGMETAINENKTAISNKANKIDLDVTNARMEDMLQLQNGFGLWCGTEEEYNAIADKKENILYFIKEV
ncbi:MAG: hypothetical protein HUJ88_11485 [Fusobacterium necrophorum]|nr:hypothetical protein [Fusobacterium necrophorum]